LWPHTAFGLAVIGSLAVLSPTMMLLSLPLTMGYALAMPFAVWTSSPELGTWLARNSICAMPEEIRPVEEIDGASQQTPEPVATVTVAQGT
jgi:membrane glycosyltransferase